MPSQDYHSQSVSSHSPVVAILSAMVAVTVGCAPDAANWNWLQPNALNGKTAEKSAQSEPSLASLTGQPQGRAPEPVDPRVQEFINRLDGFDKKPATEPSGHTGIVQEEVTAQAPPSRPLPAQTDAHKSRSSANGPVTLDEVQPLNGDLGSTPADTAVVVAKPQLLGVAVEADASGTFGSEPSRTTTANAPLSATLQEQKSAEAYLAMLKEMAAKAPHDTNVQWRIQMQERALGKPQWSPPTDLPDDQRRIMAQSMEVIDQLERAAADPNQAADQALESINHLRSELRGYAGLRVPTVRLCTKVTAFGVYETLPESELTAFRSNRAIVYTEVENFESEQEEPDRWISRLSCHLELLTADGQSLWRHEEPTIEDVSRRYRSDFFLAQLVTFPPTLAPGNYVLKVTIEDLLAEKTTQGTHAFTIGGGTALSQRP